MGREGICEVLGCREGGSKETAVKERHEVPSSVSSSGKKPVPGNVRPACPGMAMPGNVRPFCPGMAMPGDPAQPCRCRWELRHGHEHRQDFPAQGLAQALSPMESAMSWPVWAQLCPWCVSRTPVRPGDSPGQYKTHGQKVRLDSMRRGTAGDRALPAPQLIKSAPAPP